jgi:hypothetical protein
VLYHFSYTSAPCRFLKETLIDACSPPGSASKVKNLHLREKCASELPCLAFLYEKKIHLIIQETGSFLKTLNGGAKTSNYQ